MLIPCLCLYTSLPSLSEMKLLISLRSGNEASVLWLW